MGGENALDALSVTEALNVSTGIWRTLDPMNNNRHGSQAILNNNAIFISAGSLFSGAVAISGFSEWYYPYGTTDPIVSPIDQSTLAAVDSVTFPVTPMYDTSIVELTMDFQHFRDLLVAELFEIEQHQRNSIILL